MRIVPNTTDWLDLVRRVRKQTDHAKSKKFIAANIDIADLETILAAIEDPT